MKTTKNNNFETYRLPTSEETNKIYKWVSEYNSSKIKKNKILSTVLSVVGLVFVGSIGVNSIETTIVGLILCLICFFLVFLCIKEKNKCIDENAGFLSGEFLVLDGTVSKIETNIDTPGCINIWFQSKDRQFNDGFYRVRQENIEIGSPLILTFPNSERTKRFSPIAFTNFMLTDEGIALHW